jgi:hypothetical protein
VPDDPHEPVVIDAQDLMGPGPVLLLRREMAIEEDLPFIEAHKSPDPPLSIRPVFLCGEVGVADGKCIEDLLQDGIKETGVHKRDCASKEQQLHLLPLEYLMLGRHHKNPCITVPSLGLLGKWFRKAALRP